MPRIAVVGSINVDLVARCSALPVAGQTVLADSCSEGAGGKGANQAVAASRAGGEVTMVGRVGDDVYGEHLAEGLAREGVDRSSISPTPGCSSGMALITVAATGENQIVVVPGANGRVTPEDVDRHAERLCACDILLLQLEIPLETVLHAIGFARRAGLRVVLDPAPAPASPFPDALLNVDLLCPNESEAALLTGRKINSTSDAAIAAKQLHERGAGAVVVTCGARGAVLYDGQEATGIGAFPSEALDTTAAGDAFAGALAVRWAETDSLSEAVLWGNAAGALSAARAGAQASMPSRCELVDWIAAHSPERLLL